MAARSLSPTAVVLVVAVAASALASLDLDPQEHVLVDGSRVGSLVYVDRHGDLVRLRYLAGPAAGPRGFRLEELPVDAKDSAPLPHGAAQEPQDAQESAPALKVIPPPQEVRRTPTPRPSDAFWQPKENSDVAKKERSSELRRQLYQPSPRFAKLKRPQTETRISRGR